MVSSSGFFSVDLSCFRVDACFDLYRSITRDPSKGYTEYMHMRWLSVLMV
uniref:Uncharacterized protein n=1 Tax=Rhizophora mucronata TaxID=61149 RepID=A0A2P2NUP7_RHIMU